MKKQLFSIFSLAFLLGNVDPLNAQYDASLNFDGIDDEVAFGNSINSLLDPLNTITVEAWVNPSSVAGNGIVAGNYNTDAINGQMQFLLRRDGDQYSFWVDGGTGFQGVFSGAGTVAMNSWQHIAGTWDGAELKIYINGTLISTLTGVAGTSFATTTNSFKMGVNMMNENFTGSIDEVRIWTTARTASEIQSNMSCTVNQESAGLIAYYPFNDGAASGANTGNTILHDVTGNGYNGSLMNFSLTGATSNFVTDARSNYLALQSSIGSTAMVDRLGGGIAADFNGDGSNDLLVRDDFANTRLYLNDGDGNFSAFSQITTGYGGQMSAGDVDGDGDMDFSIAYGQNLVNVYINTGSPTFTPIIVTMNGTGAASVAKLVDLNNDSKLDLIIGNNSFGATDSNEVWLNTGTTGSAAFTYSGGLANNTGPRSSISVGDVDGDGDKDILTGGPSWGAKLYLNNNNNGTFSSGAAVPAGYSAIVELTDWDFDGDLDAMIYDSYNNYGLRISKNDGSGNFSAVSAPLLQSAASNQCYLKDLNGDGFLDAVMGYWGGTGKIYLNTGCSMVLQTSCEYNLGYSDNGNTVADFNGDGNMDVFCLARDHKSTLYINYLTPAITPALPQITSAPAVTACEGANAVLTATAAGPETIEWYAAATGGGVLATGTTYTVTAAAGSYTYYADAVNSNGCYTSGRTLVNLTVNPVPVITAVSGNVAVCGDASGTFGVVSAGTNTYQWYYGNSVAPFDSAMITGGFGETGFTSDTMTIQQLITNSYNNYFVYAAVTNQFNCTSYSANDTIWANAVPVVGVNASANTVCAGTGITLAGTGADTYSWSDGVTDNVSFVPGATHTYTVTGTDLNGCQDSETVAITVNPMPSVVTSVSGITITAAENGAAYQWLDCNNGNAMIAGETNQSFTASVNGNYAVEVTLNGCVDTSACEIITTVGMNSLTENNGVRCYPNPATDLISVECNANSVISIVNVMGQQVMEVKASERVVKIDTHNFASGIYFVKVKTGNDIVTVRLVVE